MINIKVLMVCMGNICRSPTAHGVFQDLIVKAELDDRISVDSAGTHAYHVGEPPDLRSQETALQHGIDLSTQRARQVGKADFDEFDYICAMDQDNYRRLLKLAGSDVNRQKVHLFLQFTEDDSTKEVPDPYYGGPQGFEKVFQMVYSAARGLLREIQRRHLAPPG